VRVILKRYKQTYIQDALEEQLHYSYNDLYERNDSEYRQNRSKDVWENVKWEEKISLIGDQEKMDILIYIRKKWLIIDSLKYDVGNDQLIALSVTIWEVGEYNDDWDDDLDDDWNDIWDDDFDGTWDGNLDSRHISIYPEFIVNKIWHIQRDKEDCFIDIGINRIREIIADNTKYTFLP